VLDVDVVVATFKGANVIHDSVQMVPASLVGILLVEEIWAADATPGTTIATAAVAPMSFAFVVVVMVMTVVVAVMRGAPRGTSTPNHSTVGHKRG